MRIVNLPLFIVGIIISLADSQNLKILKNNVEVQDEPILVGGNPVDFVCQAEGLAAGENPGLNWYNKDGSLLLPNWERIQVYNQRGDFSKLTMNIDGVIEEDAGTYKCNGTLNGQPRSVDLTVRVSMPLDITEEQAPRNQEFVEGSSPVIKCQVQGSGFTVTWYKKDQNGVIGIILAKIYKEMKSDMAEINSRIVALKTVELQLLGTIQKMRMGRTDEAIQDITNLARKTKATVFSLEQKIMLHINSENKMKENISDLNKQVTLHEEEITKLKQKIKEQDEEISKLKKSVKGLELALQNAEEDFFQDSTILSQMDTSQPLEQSQPEHVE